MGRDEGITKFVFHVRGGCLGASTNGKVNCEELRMLRHEDEGSGSFMINSQVDAIEDFV